MSLPRCNRCHRVLKDAASIAVGLGPTCFAKVTGKPLPRQNEPQAPSSTKGRPITAPRRRHRAASDGTISLDEWAKSINEEVPQGRYEKPEEEQDGEEPPEYEERAHGKAVSPLESNRIVSLLDQESNTEV